MPDNKKQGRSNKTMTFFVCFLAALAGLLNSDGNTGRFHSARG